MQSEKNFTRKEKWTSLITKNVLPAAKKKKRRRALSHGPSRGVSARKLARAHANERGKEGLRQGI